MDIAKMRSLVSNARVARLATLRVDGRPHIVPVCFCLAGDVAYSAVDAKPKKSTRLRRLENVRGNAAVCLLVDHYDEDWSRLWWVRLDGRGREVDDPAEIASSLAALAAKYQQYVAEPPVGPVLAVDVTAWSGWSGRP